MPAGGGETDGILDAGGQGDRIGPGNTIGWNGIGLQLDGTDDVQVDGNRIGTDVSGLDALPNGIGVDIIGSARTGLGFAGEPDTISGNRLDVRDGGKITKIEAELIGPTSLGNTELKPYPGGLPAASDNLFKGVPSGGLWVEDKAEHTLIGGDGTGEGVVIGGIDGTGLLADSHTLMVKDHIGVGRDGKSALAITGDGIVFKDAPESGITDSIVAHDGKAGIVVDGRDGVAIVDTPIFDNHQGGIRIPEPSATVPPPKLISAVNNGSGTDISTHVKIPHGEFGRIQFWATATCEAGGAGRKLLDTSHDISAGLHHDLKAFSADTEAVGTAITATLTVGRRAATGAPIGRTSTFSDCVPVEPAKKK